jgi:hypothetical protein
MRWLLRCHSAEEAKTQPEEGIYCDNFSGVVMCVFAGGFGKNGCFLVVFGGENVVDCVVNVVF